MLLYGVMGITTRYCAGVGVTAGCRVAPFGAIDVTSDFTVEGTAEGTLRRLHAGGCAAGVGELCDGSPGVDIGDPIGALGVLKAFAALLAAIIGFLAGLTAGRLDFSHLHGIAHMLRYVAGEVVAQIDLILGACVKDCRLTVDFCRYRIFARFRITLECVVPRCFQVDKHGILMSTDEFVDPDLHILIGR